MKKKVLSILLAAVMLMSVIPLSASAASSGTCGDNLTWTLDDVGLLTISGTGEMGAYNPYDNPIPWDSEKDSIKTVVMESGVTSIAQAAFSDCIALESVTIPSGVTSIGWEAFSGCTSLSAITIPNGVTVIDMYTFSGCTSLTSVVIPESVTAIGTEAFSDCTSLTSIVIPNGVTGIWEAAFSGCTSLTNVTIPSSVTQISINAFDGTPYLTASSDKDGFAVIGGNLIKYSGSGGNITIPNTVKVIGDEVFKDSASLAGVTISSGVTNIASSAFQNCTSLESVIIPDTVRIINFCAFSGCTALKSITIPSSVKSLMEDAFADCTALSSIRCEGNAPSLSGKNPQPPFTGVTATAYYPAGDSTWTSEVMQSYGGNITWVSYGGTGEGEGGETGGDGGNAPVNPPVVDTNPPVDEPVDPDAPTEPTQFKDVPADAYYTDAVSWAVENGITQGTSEDEFNPNASCTRAQAVTFLWRAAGSPKVEGATGFSDVAEDAYYADAVKWAVANGITQGTGNGKFSPNVTCDRAQIVTFMYRAEGSPEISGNIGFNDVDSDDYYNAAVEWAVQNGITQGTGNGQFSPDSNCIRAQIVTFLYRAYA